MIMIAISCCEGICLLGGSIRVLTIRRRWNNVSIIKENTFFILTLSKRYYGSAHGATVIVVGRRLGYLSSIPGWGCFHFTLH